MDDEMYVFEDSKQTAGVEYYHTKDKNLADYSDKFKLKCNFQKSFLYGKQLMKMVMF